MKLLRSILFSMLMGIAVAAHAMDQDVQVDLLMAKITNALKQNRVADALPAFAQLESMEPTLQNPLSEGFHFLYIDTLDKSGNHAKALSRANIYMDKFGKQGKYYDKVIEIMSRLQDQVDQETKVAVENKAIEKKKIEDRCHFIRVRFCAIDKETMKLQSGNFEDTDRYHQLKSERDSLLDEGKKNHSCEGVQAFGIICRSLSPDDYIE